MKILLTGANGYIGKRLLTVLIDLKHEVVCCVRDEQRFSKELKDHPLVQVIEVDLLKKKLSTRFQRIFKGLIIWCTLCRLMKIIPHWRLNVQKISALI